LHHWNPEICYNSCFQIISFEIQERWCYPLSYTSIHFGYIVLFKFFGLWFLKYKKHFIHLLNFQYFTFHRNKMMIIVFSCDLSSLLTSYFTYYQMTELNADTKMHEKFPPYNRCTKLFMRWNHKNYFPLLLFLNYICSSLSDINIHVWLLFIEIHLFVFRFILMTLWQRHVLRKWMLKATDLIHIFLQYC
jgi:hypothetical protein